ncbi:MAG: Fibronectin type III domain protein, partial [Candidatus Daviesbacteria bacterium GW2011_GWB1_41_5]
MVNQFAAQIVSILGGSSQSMDLAFEGLLATIIETLENKVCSGGGAISAAEFQNLSVNTANIADTAIISAVQNNPTDAANSQDFINYIGQQTAALIENSGTSLTGSELTETSANNVATSVEDNITTLVTAIEDNNISNFEELPITTVADISLKQGTTSLATNSASALGTYTGTDKYKTYTIQNVGTKDLTLTGSIVSISNDTEGSFSVFTPPAATIGVLDSETFIIKFTPTSLGTKTALLSIESNDADTPVFN